MADSVPVSSLELDFKLYPRPELSRSNVAQIREALGLGAALTPVVAWRGPNKVIDGFHRITAVRQLRGVDAYVDVEWRDYESKADAFLDAARLNASHGLKISSGDFEHLQRRATELGIAKDALSSCLKVPVSRLAVVKKPPPRGWAQTTSSAQRLAAMGSANPRLSHTLEGLAHKLDPKNELGPDHIPTYLARVSEARKGRNKALLYDVLLDTAALFIWWASRTDASRRELDVVEA